MNTPAKTKPTQAVTVRSIVSNPAIQQRFKEVLKDRSEQFVSSLLNISNSMKDVEPNSIVQSAMIAATLDLPIDRNLGFAWIVPFKNKGEKQAQFQMGHRGFIQLALRSGQYKRMNARAVNAEAVAGYDEVGEPRIDWDKIDETLPVAGYVFAFQLVNGFTKCCYWSKQRVEEHAKRYSQSYRGGYDSPWKSHFDAMALKTVIKNELPKWGIMSIQMQRAVETDQGVITADGTVQFVDKLPEPVKTPKFDGAPVVEIVTQEATQTGAEALPSDFEAPEAPSEPKTAPEPPKAQEKADDGLVVKLLGALTKSGATVEQLLGYCATKTGLFIENPANPPTLDDINPSKLKAIIEHLEGNTAIGKQIKGFGL